MPYSSASNFDHAAGERTGVLLVNLGTPDAPTPAAVRRYLKEFLWDPRVIEMSRPLWWLVLNGVILNVRPKRSAHAYATVWTDEGSPLLAISQRQRDALQAALDAALRGPVSVALGMRYGNPSVADALRELRDAGTRRLLVLPLYPQYSATTTASVFDAVTAELQRWRWLPELRFVNHYHDDPGCIEALAASVRRFQEAHGAPDRLLMSFHGIPRRYLLGGDPYHCECQKTGRLLAEALGLAPDRWQLSFQSRVGREEWLRPYTDETLKRWGAEGVRSVQVICPGFSADCLETLEEIALQNRDAFLAAGGKDYAFIPCLNDDPAHVDALSALVRRHLQGWPEADPAYDAAAVAAARAASRERAVAAGAER
jgi:protoporphyrin/coproporphyrin ferrochelatase